VRSSGLIAMDLASKDELVAAKWTTDENDVMLATTKGQSITFPIASMRTSLRASGGVRAIKISSGDSIISMDVMYPEHFVLTVTIGGYGKLTPQAEYPRQKRAGSGVRTFHVTDKTGEVIDARVVKDSQQLMIISVDGIVTRTPVREKDPSKGITIQGRSTQGVRLMRLEGNDKVAATTCFD
jgi:DNA gyrase subunit A